MSVRAEASSPRLVHALTGWRRPLTPTQVEGLH